MKKSPGKTASKGIVVAVLYGFLFVVLLPFFLFFWAANLDKVLQLPVPKWEPAGIVIAISGGILLVIGMLQLLILGKGLPMNIMPPKRFVTQGIYHWLSHPIYLGATLLSVGLALWFRSGSGLYIVTPVLVMAMSSLVCGYEHYAILNAFGDTARQYRPIFSIPRRSSRYRHLVIMVTIFVLTELYLSALSYLLGLDLFHNILLFASVSAAVLLIDFYYVKVWNGMKRFSEWIANSRHDWLFFGDQFRIINHSVFSGVAGVVGAGIFGYVIGNTDAVLLLTLCVILGAAGFAQFRWGSKSLLRPFGYWGAILGGLSGLIIAVMLFHVSLPRAAVAAILCATFTQAIGRLRCLSQGCCHGIVTREELGIRVWQSQSRVVMLSGLRGRYILPTQLYSMIFNLLLGLLLFSAWAGHRLGASLIVGLYFVLTGIERFTEDAYRGERQTKLAKGLQENQWIAVCATVAGMIISVIPFPPSANAPGRFSLALLGTALICGLIVAFAMSMDFPTSNVRFSRLSG
jgi:protein-S-isoprenylcysteine O-methyltransferase Ste14